MLHQLQKRGEQATEIKVDTFLEKLKIDPVKPPLQIKADNIISICITFILINGISFVALGELRSQAELVAIQSINYILFMVFSVLVLVVYYRMTMNNRGYEEDVRTRTQKAIDLAIFANCFEPLPQVKLISSFDDNAAPSNYHVWVEYKGQKYEIVTDMRAQKIITVVPFS